MPIYDYQCEQCNKRTENITSVAKREEPIPCPACGGIARHVIGDRCPAIRMYAPGSVQDDRDDKYWDNAEKLRLQREKKRLGEQKEKERYGDKETVATEEAKIKNYEQTGNQESANNVAKKLEAVKK